MKVSIKEFNVEMEVKSSGIEFEVRNTQGNHLGDCYLTMTGLIWCRGKTTKQNGKQISWEQFIEMMDHKAK